MRAGSSSFHNAPVQVSTKATSLPFTFIAFALNMSEPAGPQPKRSQYYMDPDNLDEELAKVPLFMTRLPEEENDTLEALQSLVYDGTPEGIRRITCSIIISNNSFIEIAENFKNQGNDCFKEGKTKYQDAIQFYTRAIDTDCKDKKIIEACYANRAAVNLELRR